MMHINLNLIWATLLTSCLLFLGNTDLSAQQWERVGSTPFLKHHTNGFGFNGKAYLLEGIGTNSDPGGVSNEMWEYNPDSMTFTRLPDFPGAARAIAIGDDWNGKYYYGFGTTGGSIGLSDLWEFDPIDTSWTQLPSCPCTGRSHPAFVAHNDKIFMGAGRSRTGDLNDWWEYDMITQQWEQKTNIPGRIRHHPFQFALGNDIYVGGGHVANWQYWSTTLEVWVSIDDTPLGRVAGTQFDYNGKGYLLAGDQADHSHLNFFETFMRYDPAVGSWQYLPPLPNGSRWAPASFILDGDLYFLCGVDYDNVSDASMWKFNLDALDAPNSITPLSNLATQIRAYPNPFQNVIKLKGEQLPRGAFNAKITNIMGETMMTLKNVDPSGEIDLSSLSNGVYFLIPEEQTTFSSIKLLKQN